MKKLILCFALLSLAACSSSGSGSSSRGPASEPEKAGVHNAAACPMINGRFNAADKMSHVTTETKSIPGGVEFNHTDIIWLVDGLPHDLDKSQNVYYTGACEAQAIEMTLFQGSKMLARVKHRLTTPDQLVTESKSYDARIPEKEDEIWYRD